MTFLGKAIISLRGIVVCYSSFLLLLFFVGEIVIGDKS